MCLLFATLLLFSTILGVESGSRSCYKNSQYRYKAMTRTLCIAATEMEWNYAPKSSDETMDLTGSYENEAEESLTPSNYNMGPIYKKNVYRRFSYNSNRKTCDWSSPMNHDNAISLMGPTLRAVVGDTLKIHFYNNCSDQSHSVVPKGLYYQQSEDSSAAPGEEVSYQWIVTDSAGPSASGSLLSSRTWMYHGGLNYDKDVNTGLVGVIVVVDARFIVSDRARKSASACDVDQEVVLMMGTFDESQSWLVKDNLYEYMGSESEDIMTTQRFIEANTRQTLNGFMYGNLNQDVGLVVAVGDRVRWSILSIHTDSSVTSASLRWENDVVSDESGHFVKSVTFSSPGYAAVDMVPQEIGEWILASNNEEFEAAGMIALYTVLPASSSVATGDDDASMSLGRGALYAVFVTFITASVLGVAVMSFYMIKSAFRVPFLQQDMSPILADSSHHSEALAVSSFSKENPRSIEM